MKRVAPALLIHDLENSHIVHFAVDIRVAAQLNLCIIFRSVTATHACNDSGCNLARRGLIDPQRGTVRATGRGVAERICTRRRRCDPLVRRFRSLTVTGLICYAGWKASVCSVETSGGCDEDLD